MCRFCLLDIAKCGRSDYASWCTVSDPENEVTAALVGQGDAVLHQLAHVERVLGFFELDVLVFPVGHPFMQLCYCGSHNKLINQTCDSDIARPAAKSGHLT